MPQNESHLAGLVFYLHGYWAHLRETPGNTPTYCLCAFWQLHLHSACWFSQHLPGLLLSIVLRMNCGLRNRIVNTKVLNQCWELFGWRGPSPCVDGNTVTRGVSRPMEEPGLLLDHSPNTSRCIWSPGISFKCRFRWTDHRCGLGCCILTDLLVMLLLLVWGPCSWMTLGPAHWQGAWRARLPVQPPGHVCLGPTSPRPVCSHCPLQVLGPCLWPTLFPPPGAREPAGCGGAPDPEDEGQDRAGEPDLQHARAAGGAGRPVNPVERRQAQAGGGAERPQAGPGGPGRPCWPRRRGRSRRGGPRPDSIPPRARELLVHSPCRSHTQQCCLGPELPARCSYFNLIQHNFKGGSSVNLAAFRGLSSQAQPMLQCQTEQLTRGRGLLPSWGHPGLAGSPCAWVPGRLPGPLPTQPQHPWSPSRNIPRYHQPYLQPPFPEEATLL